MLRIVSLAAFFIFGLTGPLFASQQCTNQMAQPCHFTITCSKGKTCSGQYIMSADATPRVAFQCTSGALKKEHCASPDVWQSSCKWSGDTCGCSEATDQGFQLNVKGKCH